MTSRRYSFPMFLRISSHSMPQPSQPVETMAVGWWWSAHQSTEISRPPLGTWDQLPSKWCHWAWRQWCCTNVWETPTLGELQGSRSGAFHLFGNGWPLEHFSYRMVGDVRLFLGSCVHETDFLYRKVREWIPLKLVHILRISDDFMDFFGVIRRIRVVLEGLVLMKASPSIL